MKKRRRKRRRRFLALLFIIVVGLGIIYYLFPSYFSKEGRELKALGYQESAIKLILKKDIDKEVLDSNVLSKTLEVALLENEFQNENLDTYLEVSDMENVDSITNLNDLKTLEYSNEEVKSIFKELKSNEIDYLVGLTTKIENVTSYFKEDYFIQSQLEKYALFKEEHPTYDYAKVVTYINAGRDSNFYTSVVSADTSKNELILVNKYHKLSKNFVPQLATINSAYTTRTLQATPVAKAAFEKMCSDAKALGLTIKALSVYRSYDSQYAIYWSQADPNDPASIVARDQYSARAGHSEHQTGLAFDVQGLTSSVSASDEYKWYKDSAYKYGFILRYEKGKEDITGYSFEPWHLRYVGLEAAKYIYEHKITFDEYYAYFVANQ